MRVLCTADVHMGRRSTRLPSHLDDHTHSSSAAWLRLVDSAVREEVDLVVIAGDLVDQANRYFEAAGSLERGLRRLDSLGIATCLVAGNHDHDVLPKLLDGIDLPSVRLLGRAGHWERHTLTSGGGTVHVDGWSFPAAHFSTSPLEGYRPVEDGAPTLALLHADLDQPGSRYGPVRSTDLRRFPDTIFVLGHVHGPRSTIDEAGARFVYPGSPQALDPGETGAHGAFLLEIGTNGTTGRWLPLSSTCYALLEVGIGGIERPEDVDHRVVTAMWGDLSKRVSESSVLRCVRYRLRITGATRLRREIELRLNALLGELELPEGEAVASVESVELDTRPVHDLTALADGIGAPAVLARILRDERLGEPLKSGVRRLVREIHESRSFVEVGTGGDDLAALEAEADHEVRHVAGVLLDELLEQKEVAS